MAEVEVAEPATTSQCLSNLPLAMSAGNAVCSLYNGSKSYNYLTQYALGTMESSVKRAASAVAPVVVPVVKRLDKPIQAVDSYIASKLVQLEEKVPAVKSQPDEVMAYLTETKGALATKISESHTAISARIADGKDSLTGGLNSRKEAVYSKISAGSEAVANSRAGVAVSEGKQAIAHHFAQGKETLGKAIVSGRDAFYTRIQNGAESLANTRAGSLVGSGVDHTLVATENLVEYLLPEIESEQELGECETKEKDIPMVGLPRTSDDSPITPPKNETVGRVERMRTLSCKVKLRMQYRSMQRLQAMQKNCKAALEQLKLTVDLLKIAQATRDGMDKRYQTVTTTLKDLEDQLKQLLSRKPYAVDVSWLPKDDDEEDSMKIEWLNPKSQGVIQSSLDYAKQLSEKVFHTFQSVTVVTTRLPSHLKGGATQGYQYAQEMYSTLKTVKTPTDLTASALNRISSLIETQLSYVTRLGTYLSSMLQRPKSPPKENPADDEIGGDPPADDENEEEDLPAGDDDDDDDEKGEDGDNESSNSENDF